MLSYHVWLLKCYYVREVVGYQVYLIVNVLKIRKKDSLKNKTILTQHYYRQYSCYVSVKLLVSVYQTHVCDVTSCVVYHLLTMF